MVVVTSYVSYRNLEATFWHRSLPDTICNIRRHSYALFFAFQTGNGKTKNYKMNGVFVNVIDLSLSFPNTFKTLPRSQRDKKKIKPDSCPFSGAHKEPTDPAVVRQPGSGGPQSLQYQNLLVLSDWIRFFLQKAVFWIPAMRCGLQFPTDYNDGGPER